MFFLDIQDMYYVCFQQTISLALHPFICGRGNVIAVSFMDSYSACCGDQFRGKDTKNGLSVVQM